MIQHLWKYNSAPVCKIPPSHCLASYAASVFLFGLWTILFHAYWTAWCDQGIPLTCEQTLSDNELIFRGFVSLLKPVVFCQNFPFNILHYDSVAPLFHCRVSQTGCNFEQMFDDTRGWKWVLRLKKLFDFKVSNSTGSPPKSAPAGFDKWIQHKWDWLCFSAFSVGVANKLLKQVESVNGWNMEVANLLFVANDAYFDSQATNLITYICILCCSVHDLWRSTILWMKCVLSFIRHKKNGINVAKCWETVTFRNINEEFNKYYYYHYQYVKLIICLRSFMAS